jgi:hypothetical protein
MRADEDSGWNHARRGACPRRAAESFSRPTMPKLIVLEGPEAGMEFDLGPVNVLGSDVECGVLVREIPSGGMALGISPRAREQYADREVPFLSGTTVLLVSDGVTEAMNAARDPFGHERLRASFLRRAEDPVERLPAGILDDVRAFTGPGLTRRNASRRMGA